MFKRQRSVRMWIPPSWPFAVSGLNKGYSQKFNWQLQKCMWFCTELIYMFIKISINCFSIKYCRQRRIRNARFLRQKIKIKTERVLQLRMESQFLLTFYVDVYFIFMCRVFIACRLVCKMAWVVTGFTISRTTVRSYSKTTRASSV